MSAIDPPKCGYVCLPIPGSVLRETDPQALTRGQRGQLVAIKRAVIGRPCAAYTEPLRNPVCHNQPQKL